MRKKALAASIALAATLVTGCSPQAGVAATVNGDTVTTAEVDQAMELGPFFAEQPAPANLVASLIQAPVIIDAAGDAGIGVSEGDAAAFLDSIEADAIKVEGEYPEAVVELVRANIITQELQMSPDAQNIIEEVNRVMESADIELNPRYGSWDLSRGGLQQDVPDWIYVTN